MQDDVYMIVSDGWKEAAKPRLIVEDKEKKTKEQPDFAVGKLKFKAELIPTALVTARYFAKEAAAIEGLEAEAAGIDQKLEELKEEHGSEDGLMAEVVEDGKIVKSLVASRLKAIKGDKGASEERKVLEAYVDLVEQAAIANREIKSAHGDLENKVAAQYGKLSEADIKTLVVEDKWLAILAASVQSELDRVSQGLTGRMRELAERYGTPLPQVVSQVEELEKRVAGHLKKMGFTI
jgi:type I restriction enzyme M protein